MKNLSKQGLLNDVEIDKILSQEKSNQIPKIKLDEGKIRQVLPKDIEVPKIEDFVINAVDKYQKIVDVLPSNVNSQNMELFVMKAISHYMKHLERKKTMDVR